MKTGIELIAEERQRQIDSLGWSKEHDAAHTDESLASVAALYAMPKALRQTMVSTRIGNMVGLLFPKSWHFNWWKPCDRIKELQKAGALIAAEIDRINHSTTTNE